MSAYLIAFTGLCLVTAMHIRLRDLGGDDHALRTEAASKDRG